MTERASKRSREWYVMSTQFTEFPLMETARLVLRRLTEEDLDDLFNMRKDPDMHEYTDTMPDTSLKDTKEYLERMDKGINEGKWLLWGIQSKETHRIIGSVSVWNFTESRNGAELGYGIVTHMQGNGYMAESLQAVIDYCFRTIGMDWIEACTEEGNESSTRLLENLGFVQINKVIDQGYNTDRLYNMLVFRKVKQ